MYGKVCDVKWWAKSSKCQEFIQPEPINIGGFPLAFRWCKRNTVLYTLPQTFLECESLGIWIEVSSSVSPDNCCGIVQTSRLWRLLVKDLWSFCFAKEYAVCKSAKGRFLYFSNVLVEIKSLWRRPYAGWLATHLVFSQKNQHVWYLCPWPSHPNVTCAFDKIEGKERSRSSTGCLAPELRGKSLGPGFHSFSALAPSSEIHNNASVSGCKFEYDSSMSWRPGRPPSKLFFFCQESFIMPQFHDAVLMELNFKQFTIMKLVTLCFSYKASHYRGKLVRDPRGNQGNSRRQVRNSQPLGSQSWA